MENPGESKPGRRRSLLTRRVVWVLVALAVAAAIVVAVGVGRMRSSMVGGPPVSLSPTPTISSAAETSRPSATRPTTHQKGIKFDGVCDGRTDDTDAMQSVLRQLKSQGGGVLRLPRGTCRISSTGDAGGLQLSGDITIVGEGRDLSTISFTPSGAGYVTLFDVVGANVAVSQLTIRRDADNESVMFNVRASQFALSDVKLDGGRPEAGQTSHGIQIVEGDGHIEDLSIAGSVITGCDYGLFQANNATTVVDGFLVEDSTFINNVADDLEFNAPNGRMHDVTVRRSEFRDNLYDSDSGAAGIGIGLANVQGAVLEDNSFDGYWWAPVHIEDRSSDVVVRRNTFTNVFKKQRDWTSAIFVVSGSSKIAIQENRIDLVGSGKPAAALYVGAGGGEAAPHDIQLTNNIIVLRPGDQFVSAHGSHVTERGNQYG